MCNELENSVKAFETFVGEVESPVVVANTVSYCTGFSSFQEAEAHIRECRSLTRHRCNPCLGRGNCHPYTAEELAKVLPKALYAPLFETFPFGDKNGNIWPEIKVIVPLDHAR